MLIQTNEKRNDCEQRKTIVVNLFVVGEARVCQGEYECACVFKCACVSTVHVFC